MLEIKYSEKAEKQLKIIARANLDDAKRIIKGIENYAEYPEHKHDIKSLKGKYHEF